MAHFQLDTHGKCKKSLCHNPMFAQKTLQHSHSNDLIISFLMLHYLNYSLKHVGRHTCLHVGRQFRRRIVTLNFSVGFNIIDPYMDCVTHK